MLSRAERLLVPRAIYEAMVQHAQAELPNECCGLLGGVRVGDVLRALAWHPLVNEAASPIEYRSEPRSMFLAIKEMRKTNHEVVAIYHSHPTSEPIPSRTDLERNYSPDVVNIIIGLRSRLLFLFPLGKSAYLFAGPPNILRWWLTDSEFEEAIWTIED